MAWASGCQGQPPGSSYWSCHQHFTVPCRLPAWESSNRWKEAPLSFQPGARARERFCSIWESIPILMALWSQPYPGTMVQICSAGGKRRERGLGLLFSKCLMREKQQQVLIVGKWAWKPVILHLIIHWLVYWPPLPTECKHHEGRDFCLLCPSLYPWIMAHWHSWMSICWVNEWLAPYQWIFFLKIEVYNQTEKDKYHIILIRGTLKNNINEFIYKTETD